MKKNGGIVLRPCSPPLPAAHATGPSPRRVVVAGIVVRQGELPKTWEGQAFAIDGDTIGGIGLKPPIRLWGIQHGEDGKGIGRQACARRARGHAGARRSR